MTRGVLALTVTCARCHDHKFDPIPTADYYALYGVFKSSREDLQALDERAEAIIVAAAKFADESPFPDAEALYEDVYISYP